MKKNRDMKEVVKTFNDACLQTLEFHDSGESGFNKKYGCLNLSENVLAYFRAKTVCSALNNGWIPDFSDRQTKYLIVCKDDRNKQKESSLVVCASKHTRFSCSSMFFKSVELAEYAAIQFPEIFKNLLK
jgi:hypothetical protein